MNVFSTNFRITRFGRGATILTARNGKPLDLDTIQAKCPAVFAEGKHVSRSAKYTYISTRELLTGMAKEGFMPFEVRNGGSGDEDKRQFTKHMIRFRHAGDIGPTGEYYQTGRSQFAATAKVGDAFHEVILVNAHDGTSSYQMHSGWFKITCLNGLFVADRNQESSSIRIHHKGDVIGQVIEAAFSVIDRAGDEARRIEHMRTIELTPMEQLNFADAARHLRWEEAHRAPLEPAQVNQPRREADARPDLWSTFNRVQENLVRGGVHYPKVQDMRNAQGQIVGHRTIDATTRPVNNIAGDIKLNKALWVLAEKMAFYKTAELVQGNDYAET